MDIKNIIDTSKVVFSKMALIKQSRCMYVVVKDVQVLIDKPIRAIFRSFIASAASRMNTAPAAAPLRAGGAIRKGSKMIEHLRSSTDGVNRSTNGVNRSTNGVSHSTNMLVRYGGIDIAVPMAPVGASDGIVIYHGDVVVHYGRRLPGEFMIFVMIGDKHVVISHNDEAPTVVIVSGPGINHVLTIERQQLMAGAGPLKMKCGLFAEYSMRGADGREYVLDVGVNHGVRLTRMEDGFMLFDLDDGLDLYLTDKVVIDENTFEMRRIYDEDGDESPLEDCIPVEDINGTISSMMKNKV